MNEKLARDGGTPVRTAPFPTWPVWDGADEKALLEVIALRRVGTQRRHACGGIRGGVRGLPGHDVLYCGGQRHVRFGTRTARAGRGVRRRGDRAVVHVCRNARRTALLGRNSRVRRYRSRIRSSSIPLRWKPPLRLAQKRSFRCISPASRPIWTASWRLRPRHNLRVLEDAAQAHGAAWRDQGVGGVGDLGSFSFQSSKNLNAGEGGAICTNDQELAELTWSLMNVGRLREGAWYQHERLGWNYRLSEFHGALLRAQLTRVPEQMARREANASYLDTHLADIPGITPQYRLAARDRTRPPPLYVPLREGGLWR